MCDKIYHKCRVTIIFLTGAVLELPDPLFIFYPPHSEQNGGKETELDFWLVKMSKIIKDLLLRKLWEV